MATLEGIDVSEYQGTINWEQVRLAGKSFAFIKASEGLYGIDPTFSFNWAGAKAWGLIRGAYHFFRPGVDGSMQADYMHDYVRRNGHFIYGDMIVLDVEETDNMPAALILNRINQFVVRARVTINKQVLIYTGPNFWINVLGNPTDSVIANCPLWLADYGPNVPPLQNWPSGLSFWQYSDSGHVPGVPTLCDLNRYYGDWASLRKLARFP